MLNIVFMGTPDFAKESLESVVKSGHKISMVITTEDKPKGRGMKMQFNPVKEYAVSEGLVIEQPTKLKENEELFTKLKNANPDLFVVVAYGKILPNTMLQIPKMGSINVHASLLPKYRGAAPIQWAIINGEKETGVTTMYLSEKMDAGDIILQKSVKIEEDETTGELWNRLSETGAELLVKTLEKIETGAVLRKRQEENYTLAPMLKKEMAKIDWNNKTSSEIKNLVRGLNPIMGAYAVLEGKKYKIWTVQIVEKLEGISTKEELPGTILMADEKKGMYIKTIDGILSILEIQPENARKMQIHEFLNGNKIQAGSVCC